MHLVKCAQTRLPPCIRPPSGPIASSERPPPSVPHARYWCLPSMLWNGRSVVKVVTSILAVLLLVTFFLSTQLDIDRYPDVSQLQELDVQDISTTTDQPWRKSWKFGLLSRAVSVTERILANINEELALISTQREEAQSIFEHLSHRLPNLQEEVKELDVVVRNQELRLREYNDLRNVHLHLPHKPLLPPKSSGIIDEGIRKFQYFDDAIDFRHCSISKQFQFYLYPLTTKDLVANNLYNEFKKNPMRTDNPDLACIFIYVGTSLDRQELTYYGKYGHNHLIIDTGDEERDLKFTDAAIIMADIYHRASYRPAYDMSAFLRVRPSDPRDFEDIPPLLPHDRSLLVSFESTANGITVEERDAFAIFEASANHSMDSVHFNIDCIEDATNKLERFGLCSNKTARREVLEQSTFVLIFPEIKSQQNRMYEALKAGAIPVVLSKSAILPFSDMIDWREAVIQIPTARFSELHFILRSFSLPDVLELRRKGRMLFESYLANTEALVRTTLSVLRYRLQLPATLPETKPATPLFRVEHSFHAPTLTNITRPDPDDEKTGPLGPPVASKTFSHNFTVFGMYAHKIWNQYPFYTVKTPEFFLEDAILPSEAEFYNETNLGMRPIAPGSGDTFSEALGGNRPQEQFTIVIITYNRDAVLMSMLESLNNTPFLNRIIVIWNNLDREPPTSWPRLNVDIYFVRAEKNTLNNRFYPYDLIETEAVLSLDDDMDLKRAEIVFAFRSWRQDRTKIVGFPARYHAKYGDGIFYNSNHTCQHSMILTGAAFIHKSYLYAYTYYLPKAIHNRVDEVMNCEDIAMNFLVAHLTRQPPIKTTSKWTIRCPNCPETLSNDADHFNERHECIRYFTKVFGYNPLVFSQYRVDSVLFKTRVPANHQKCYRFV
uniref:Glyco_transf_64 domain-containing protein n=1 Tax=Panagrellus redivivus TaxID=6233 RepID=A0A7E4ULF6_PANRE